MMCNLNKTDLFMGIHLMNINKSTYLNCLRMIRCSLLLDDCLITTTGFVYLFKSNFIDRYNSFC
jgi:hypothetical protein